MLYIHHSCGYIKQIIPDLVEIGVDAIEPMMPQNDLDEQLEKYGDKMTFMGGIDNRLIDCEESTPEEIVAEVKRAMDAFAHKGRYIPYYIPSMEKKWFIYMDAVREYGQTIFQK